MVVITKMKKKTETENVLYGVGVIIRRPDGKVLLGKRYGTVGEGKWSAPGGRIEDGETPKQTARREVMEEAGMTVDDLRYFIRSIDDAYGYHFETAAYIARKFEGMPIVIGGEKHSEWRWFSLNELPKEEDIFAPALSIFEAYKEHVMYVDLV